jgi:hypothetical protein
MPTQRYEFLTFGEQSSLFISHCLASNYADMISVHSRRILRFLLLSVLGITCANLAVQVSRFLFERDTLWGLSRLLDVNNENSIPAWYSSITLLFCAILLWLISSVKQQRGDDYIKHWKGLSVIFLLLSLDEAASVHEILIPLGWVWNTKGFFMFIWVVPGMIFVLSVTLVYWKFLSALPAKTRYLFLAAGTIYVSGTIGLEMIGGQYIHSTGNWGEMGLALILALEELLEMLGILTFIYALLSYIDTNLKEVQIHFPDKPSDQAQQCIHRSQ